MHRLNRGSVLASAVGVGLALARVTSGAGIDASGTFQVSSGTANWNVGTSWDVNGTDWPSGTSATAVFNGPTASRTVPMGAVIVISGLTFHNTTSSTTTTQNGGGSMTFDSTGSSVTFLVDGTGTGRTDFATTSTFNKNVIVDVEQTTQSSTNGALSMSATVLQSPGGFTKTGPGLLFLQGAQKRWQGPTLFDTNSGRTRLDIAAPIINSSSVTVASGAQLTLSFTGTLPTTTQNYTLGVGSLFLNGSGIAAFPGAIRQDTGLLSAIDRPVVLQSDTVLHVQATAGTGNTASPTGSMTLSGAISGPGKLTFTAPNSNVEQGTLVLSGAGSSYTGGTLVAGGILSITGSGSTGLSDVTVDNSSTSGSIARLLIASGATNAVYDFATLNIKGGGTPGVADQNWIDLGSNVNEVVGHLTLNGVNQAAGVYGSSASILPAGVTSITRNDEYFSGTGVLTVTGVPEPAAAGVLMLGGLGLLARRRRRAG